mgnify:CR=1 FL=1
MKKMAQQSSKNTDNKEKDKYIERLNRARGISSISSQTAPQEAEEARKAAAEEAARKAAEEKARKEAEEEMPDWLRDASDQLDQLLETDPNSPSEQKVAEKVSNLQKNIRHQDIMRDKINQQISKKRSETQGNTGRDTRTTPNRFRREEIREEISKRNALTTQFQRAIVKDNKSSSSPNDIKTGHLTQATSNIPNDREKQGKNKNKNKNQSIKNNTRIHQLGRLLNKKLKTRRAQTASIRGGKSKKYKRKSKNNKTVKLR